MSTFRTSRELNAPPEAVFGAICDPVRLARWWGPKGFTNTFQVFEFQPGGAWVFIMHGPDGTDYPNRSEFLEIVPNVLVRLRHVVPPHFELTITLAPSPAGTLVSWAQAFDSPEVAERVRAIVEYANEQNLDRLTAEVGSDYASGT